jgi:hypothetical protein
MRMPKSKEEIMAEMDAAASEARQDFMKTIVVTDGLLAAWIERWYKKAGYTRLCQILREGAKKVV